MAKFKLYTNKEEYKALYDSFMYQGKYSDISEKRLKELATDYADKLTKLSCYICGRTIEQVIVITNMQGSLEYEENNGIEQLEELHICEKCVTKINRMFPD